MKWSAAHVKREMEAMRGQSARARRVERRRRLSAVCFGAALGGIVAAAVVSMAWGVSPDVWVPVCWAGLMGTVSVVLYLGS